jgi:hypothetical protein
VTILRPNELVVVDDRPETLGTLPADAEALGFQVRSIFDYDAAVTYICSLEAWCGFGLIDLRLPSRESEDIEWLGLEIGRLIRVRFGLTARFAYVTMLSRTVPADLERLGAATSRLGVLDKYRMDPRRTARTMAAEVGLTPPRDDS